MASQQKPNGQQKCFLEIFFQMYPHTNKEKDDVEKVSPLSF
jgi:hypothetical protein